MSDYLHDVFDDGGYLAAMLPGYARRRGQADMAWAVDAAIVQGEHLVVEGPTGTGKSIAYLVPATHHAAHGGGKVVIATANIALQEQLVDKDLPFLAEVLPWSFTYRLMKGRNNYLCLHKLRRELPDGTHLIPTRSEDMAVLRAIQRWAQTTATGDVSELATEPPPAIWARFTTDAIECPGNACPFAERCFSRTARDQARLADVIVCNDHLLFAHLQVRELTGQDLVLPAFDVVILDEAHKAADIARDFFSNRVSFGSVQRAARLLDEVVVPQIREDLLFEAERFFTALGAHRRSPEYCVRLRTPGIADSEDLVYQLNAAGQDYLDGSEEADEPEMASKLELCGLRCQSLAHWIEAGMALSDRNAVVYLDEDHQHRGVLCRRPVDVSERLRSHLFGATRATVVTSATLSTAGSFELVKGELGVPDPRELVVESPFDLAEQALLIVPSGLPEPNDPAFPGAVAGRVRQAIDLAGGRTLGLFTSYSNLHLARDRARDCGYRVLAQGDAPRTALVRAFREDTSSVLLGTESFWAGVDVPGESLSCVVIDRLPFPQPDDPVLDAIRERDRQWFLHYGLPRAIIAFKQGFGRLIRSTGDRGVVVVLDRRLLTRPYGRLFLASLSRVRVSQRLEDIRAFLGDPAERPSAAGRRP